MKYLKLTCILMLLAALTAGCTSLSPYTYTGAGVGGALGAGAGALIDNNNRWRGAMIGCSDGRCPGRRDYGVRPPGCRRRCQPAADLSLHS